MDHGACVYAASLGVVDICIGAFTKNRQRTMASSFLEMGVTAEYLVVHEHTEQLSVMDKVKSIFEPFSPALWGMTFLVFSFLGFLLMLQEVSWETLREKPSANVKMSLYGSVMAFFARRPGPYCSDKVTSWGGRLTTLAICIQILLSGAAYGAQLTTLLVRSGFSVTIESIDDVMLYKFPICVLRNKIKVLDNAYGDSRFNYAINRTFLLLFLSVLF